MMIMLANLIIDANTNHLVGALKKDIRTKIEQNSSFVNYKLAPKTYAVGETISFAGESWQVMRDQGSQVLLVLKRGLNKSEILSSFPSLNTSNSEYFSGSCNDSICRIRACRYALTGTESCYYFNDTVYLRYSWNPTHSFASYGRSIMSIVVTHWLEENPYLQTALSRNLLVSMNVIDGVFNNSPSYIRIPYASEATSHVVWGNGMDFHTATKGSAAFQNYIYNGTQSVNQNSITPAQIRPVILVKES